MKAEKVSKTWLKKGKGCLESTNFQLKNNEWWISRKTAKILEFLAKIFQKTTV